MSKIKLSVANYTNYLLRIFIQNDSKRILNYRLMLPEESLIFFLLWNYKGLILKKLPVFDAVFYEVDEERESEDVEVEALLLRDAGRQDEQGVQRDPEHVLLAPGHLGAVCWNEGKRHERYANYD